VKKFIPDLAEQTNGQVGVIDDSLWPCWPWTVARSPGVLDLFAG
jgi:hypothetical protein